MDKGYTLVYDNPKKNANIISQCLFGWTVSVIRKGVTKGLQLKDLYKTLAREKSRKWGDKLETQWKKELVNKKIKKGTPSLLKAIIRTFILEFMLYGLLWFWVNGVIRCTVPIALEKVISYYSGMNNETEKMNMYIWTGVLIGLITTMNFLYHHLTFGLSRIGMRIRIATSSLVYRKITKLSNKSLGETAVGQVVNILSNDVNRFDFVVLPLHNLWVMPFQIAYVSYIMWQQIGISSLVGTMAIVVIALPIQGYLGKLLGKYRYRISKKTDNRVKLMSEIISGIEVLKMYAWEKPFEKITRQARQTEIKDITATSYLRGAYMCCGLFLDRLALFLTIICYVLLGNHITADKVFSLALSFNILQLVLSIFYAWAVSLIAETLVSIKRLQDFLMLEEKVESNIERTQGNNLILKDVNASWTDTGSTLQSMSFQIPPGTLCAIVGPVGAGKSSILQLLLGELPLKSGKVQIGGEISYSSQDPWLFKSTVRNNILFGMPYNKELYNTVIQVCALEKDFEQFPEGDRTVVGESGAALSGGQRARINLARAVYKQADIYLLDDPLSAVDTHVGKHLFEKCINTFLKDKTRILVTHQLQYLKNADLIVMISDGTIEACGKFEDLVANKIDLAQYLEESDESQEKPKNVPDIKPVESKRRKSSMLSRLTEDSGKFEDDEEESGHDPNSKPFKEYILATKNISLLSFLIVILILSQVICAASDYWVAYWTSEEEIRYKKDLLKTDNNRVTLKITFSLNDIFDYVQLNSNIYKLLRTDYAMYVYGILILFAILVTLWRTFLFYKMCMMASVNLHSDMFHTLLTAPMRFFHVNPSGRILNRFSKDIGAVDEVLPRVLNSSITLFLVMFGIFGNVAASNPYTLVLIALVGIIFWKVATWYISTAKTLKHLEGITKSPVFSHVNSTLNGLSTIRASKIENILVEEFDHHQDIHTSAWYLILACTSSFGLWLDLLAAIFIGVLLSIFLILQSFLVVSGSMVGLALVQSINLCGLMQYGVRETADTILQLISVERVAQYTKINTEGPLETSKDKLPKSPWPKEGLIEFKNLSLAYTEDKLPVLKNLNFSVFPGQKIGIVGRTGAGKSSLISALFRLAPIDGSILIDGIDTKFIGLQDLRKKISIIPQEPVLFSATLRYNLDPFGEYPDGQLWEALEQVELKESIKSLDFMVSEGGGNFSLGQRQLVCLARAALRNNKILVLDEATANVDLKTDTFIQKTIRKRFKDCTVLTIAHRLNTIMDSDKVLVMHFGRMVEFDHAHILLQNPDGHFHKLVLETGAGMSLQLKDIAQEAYNSQISKMLV